MKKNLLFGHILMLMLALVLQSASLSAKQIVFVYNPATIDAVTGENADQPTVKLFEEQGYTVNLFPIIDITTATPEQLDSLNKADLVYIGRAVTSGNFDLGPKADAWNSISAPMMVPSMWALRNTKMNWFNTADCANIDVDPGTIFTGDILMEDPVFKGLSGTVDWWDGPYSTINTADAGNGQVLAAKNGEGYVLFVRFEPDVEFYTGSVSIPSGPRTFFSSASDNMTIDGNKYYNYLGFTEPIKKVFLNEVASMMGVFNPESIKNSRLNISASVYPVPADDQIIVEMDNLQKVDMIDLSGRTVASFDAKAEKVIMNTSNLNKGVYMLKISNNKGETLVKKITKN